MFAEKIGESCSTTGTGTFSLGGAYGAFRAWGTGFSSGDLGWYYNTNDTGSIWELGYGTYTAGSPNTLTRNLVASSTGSLINWTTTPHRIYSVPSATILKHMLAPFINGVANVPGWFVRGVMWLDYALGITAAWVKKRYVSGTVTSAGSHAEEGRFFIGLDSGATHIFASSQRMVFVDIGAANYTFTANDIGKCLDFDTTAAPRVLTMLANNAAGMGHGAYVFVRPYGSGTNGVTFTPGGSDTTDLATAPPGRMTKFQWDGAKSKWTSDYVAPSLVLLPRGRLTLTSATPVLTSTVSGATTIYYALYNGNQVPIYDGSSTFASTTFAELTNATAQSSSGKAGPAAVANNSNYDLFVWSDSGTLRLTRGPAWSSDTSRGTGAGTTELQRINGIYTNKVAITNGPGANLGTYVGTVRSNGSATIDWIFGAAASGGTAAVFGVWNCYNRVDAQTLVQDTTASWTYSSATPRAADNSSTMRASFVIGLQEDYVEAEYGVSFSSTAVSADGYASIGYDSTSAISGVSTGGGPVTGGTSKGAVGFFAAQPLGYHYMTAQESGTGTGTVTWYGQSGNRYNGLKFGGRF